MTARYGRRPGSADRLVRQMLQEMADKLEQIRPDEPITTIGRHALLQATTMDPPLLRALRAVAPEIDGEQVRRDYAAQLRQTAAVTEDAQDDAGQFFTRHFPEIAAWLDAERSERP